MKRISFLPALLSLAGACDSDSDSDKPCPEEPGVLCRWAGTGHPAFAGDGQAVAESPLYWPVDVEFTRSGAYVLDWNNHRVRRVTEEGTFETVIGSDFVGDGDPAMADLVAPGVAGTTVLLNHPTQIHELADGSLMLVAWHNHKLRRFDPATGFIYVACGRGAGFAGDGGPASAMDARLNQPASAKVAPDGTIYVLDQRNQRIRRIDPAGTIGTVAGIGMPGFAGDGGDPMMASFSFPTGPNPQPAGGLELDDQGRLYVADTLNNRVRRIDFAAGIIETVAGIGDAGHGGDGGPGVAAALNNPRDLELGPDGRLYIADELNHRIRALDLASGIIETVAGTGDGEMGENGLPGTETALNRPTGIAFDAEGRLYVSDTNNNMIRRMPLP